MGFRILMPSEMDGRIPDPGNNGYVYAIKDEKSSDVDVVFDQHLQMTTYAQANVVAVFSDWFQSFFPHDYFKFVKITTQSSFKELRTWYKDIYKKEKPFLVINPQPPEVVEDFLFAQTMFNRYNDYDPEHSRVTAKLNGAVPILENDACALVHRRNRLSIQFEIMIMEQTMPRQQDTFNRLAMNLRHKSKFTIQRTVPMLLPAHQIRTIAALQGMDWRSDEFLTYLNTISHYPIRKELRNSGQLMFFMLDELHCHVDVPSYPARDTPERSEAIEWGARVVDIITFTQDLPMEYLFLLKKEHVAKLDKPIPEDPEAISFISPIYADLDWPTELGEFKLSNRVDVELQEGDDPTLEVLPLIRDHDVAMADTIGEFIARGGDPKEVIVVRVYPNGSYKDIGTILHPDGRLELLAPRFNKLYSVNIYINYRVVNLIRDGKFDRFIGTIRTEQLPE